MDWLQNKTTQIIALVGIVGTLAGFGYTGAEYVNRLVALVRQKIMCKSLKKGLHPLRHLCNF